jgi:hypothetical protein
VVVLNKAFFWVVAGGYDTLAPLFARGGPLGVTLVGVGAQFGLVSHSPGRLGPKSAPVDWGSWPPMPSPEP